MEVEFASKSKKNSLNNSAFERKFSLKWTRGDHSYAKLLKKLMLCLQCKWCYHRQVMKLSMSFTLWCQIVRSFFLWFNGRISYFNKYSELWEWRHF